MGAHDQAAQCQSANHTLYGRRVHRDQPPKMVLRRTAKLRHFAECCELHGGKALVRHFLEEDGRMALMGLAEKETNVVFKPEHVQQQRRR